jgi:uncharacterized protein (DUF697 family)/predicted GTPase
MAIDKDRTRELLAQIDKLFHEVGGVLPRAVFQWLRDQIMGKALGEIRDLIENSRPPVLYLIGRSGHGKSSLINALANKPVAEVGHVKPTTARSAAYTIPFTELYASWQVIDSRGIFESTRPGGAAAEDAVEQLRQDIVTYKPDVILHIVAAREARNLANDLKVLKDIIGLLRGRLGYAPPVVVILTQTDLLDPPREWPLQAGGIKATRITETLDYMAREVLAAPGLEPVDPALPVKGCKLDGELPVKYLIPVAVPPGEPFWNIETLSEVIGAVLPKEAILQFFQAQRRKELLRKLSSGLIWRFSGIAAGIGAAPVPVSDMLILSPLQLVMLAIVGGISCRSFSRQTAVEFLTASGVSFGVGYALRTVAQQLVKAVPYAGPGISGAIAGAGTYAIGKSAETYFFTGVVRRPEEFRGDWKPGGPPAIEHGTAD